MTEPVNVTICVDKETKREFDTFCENVGINVTTAINMYIRAVLRNRELPFRVTDLPPAENDSKQALRDAFAKAQEESVAKGRDKITMEEINEQIAAGRRERTSE